MSRSRTHGSPTRHLQAEIRRLKKQLKQYERQTHLLDEKLDDDNDEPIIKDVPKKKDAGCPSCQEGELKMLDLGIKQLLVCDSCNFRKNVTEK